MQPYAAKVVKDFVPDYHGNIFDDIFEQYERVIIESLITSFGLDFIVKDQCGGDVDTILNVRKIGEYPDIQYKSKLNAQAYSAQESYSKQVKVSYDSQKEFIQENARIKEQKVSGQLTDSYTGAKASRNANIDLDHVIATEEIHRDRGRILAGLDGKKLANCPENLRPTDRSINRSMKEKSIPDYLEWLDANKEKRDARISTLKSKSELTDKEKSELYKLEKQNEIDPQMMLQADHSARASYEAKLRTAYYTSPRFAKDLGLAAANVGVRMGARQVFGFIFAEVWFSVKAELQKTEDPFSFEKLYTSIGKGVERGISNAKVKYKDLIGKFGEGITAGALSSFTTTLCNIFFTTAKHTVRIIRQTWASMVQATEIILFNPDDLLFGDRLCAATKILAVGGSVVVGTTVSELIAKTPVGVIPVVGDIVQAFCGTLVSGIMSCTLLCFIDRSQMVRQLIEKFNQVPTMSTNTHYFREQAKLFEAYAAELQKIDSQRFSEETAVYQSIANEIDHVGTEQELNVLLKDIFKKHHIPLPWQGDFSAFMMDKRQHLVYE